MAKALTPAQLRAAFKKFNVKFVERDGWETHNRDGHGAFNPVGLVLHHTGDDAPDSLDEKVVWEGRSDLPGPLCHWGMRDDGTLVLISSGRANHAGKGSSRVLSAVEAGYKGDYPPKPGTDDTDGNAYFYGQETFYSGLQAPTKDAYDNTVRAYAAVCDAYGWSVQRIIGHKEWTARKPDPGHLDMAEFRKDVQALLDSKKAPVKATTAPAKKTVPAPVTKPVYVALDPGVKPGKRHAQVKLLQQLLIKAGYGPIPGSISNYYGENTESAVRRFYKKHPDLASRPQDSVIGPKSFELLQKEAECPKRK